MESFLLYTKRQLCYQLHAAYLLYSVCLWLFLDRKLSPDQQFRIVDVELLKSLEIDHIFDLMVECKKVKYGM